MAFLIRIASGRTLPVLFFGYLLLIFAQVHFGSEGLVERDGYYHARLAQLFPQRWLSREFPWTQVSIWKGHFADKEFLFHLLMVPFTRDEADPVRGAQVFVTLLELGIFGAIYALLRKHGARWPLAFTALLSCMGFDFLVRLTMIRSHALSMLLAILGVHYLLEKRWRALALLGFVFSWSYTFPLVLLMFAAPFVLGRWMGGGGLDWRSPAASAGGAIAGLIVHPYTPLTLDSFQVILHIMHSAASAEPSGGIGLGNEFYARSARWFLTSSPLLPLSVLALTLGGWRAKVKVSPEAMGALVLALAWFVMTMLFPRFIEYSAPFMVIALALVARDALAGVDVAAAIIARHSRATAGALAAALLAGAGLHALSIRGLYSEVEKADPPRFRGAAAWMSEQLAPGETVVNLAWDDFPDLFYDGYRQHFLWGIDPTFSTAVDPEKVAILNAIRHGHRNFDPEKLAREFGARYLAMSRRRGTLTGGPWEPSYSDEQVVVYRLEPASSF